MNITNNIFHCTPTTKNISIVSSFQMLSVTKRISNLIVSIHSMTPCSSVTITVVCNILKVSSLPACIFLMIQYLKKIRCYSEFFTKKTLKSFVESFLGFVLIFIANMIAFIWDGYISDAVSELRALIIFILLLSIATTAIQNA